MDLKKDPGIPGRAACNIFFFYVTAGNRTRYLSISNDRLNR
jgi:hypothetical protein